MSDTTATNPGWLDRGRGAEEVRRATALVLAWSMAEPWRVGQVAFLPERHPHWILGRGATGSSAEHARVAFVEQRPGALRVTDPLAGRGISREQIAFTRAGGSLNVERLGKKEMSINGLTVESGSLEPGDVLQVAGELVLYIASRARGAISERGEAPDFDFGAPDAFGVVGESPRSWLLRDELAFAAKRRQHVLVLGPSGSGKELAARAVHGQSERAAGPFVSRNAATLPPGIIDAELFGNVKNYPNAGTPERTGLVGATDGGTLFLDELSELPESLQSHLLRLLDAGEYQRLGDSKVRRADLRVVGATNRGLDALKHDLAARFALRVEMPGLTELREDVMLVARHLLRVSAARDDGIADRFFERSEYGVEPRIAPDFVEALLRHRFTHHVRELESLLLASMSKSRGSHLDLTPDVESRLDLPQAAEAVDLPSNDRIRSALAKHSGSVTRAARELGLRNRDVLYRLMKKRRIPVGPEP